MQDPIILKRRDTLSYDEAHYWKDILYRVVKIGTELEYAMPMGVRREAFENPLIEALNPSGSYEHLGPNGVLDVQREHCGVEIRVIGRHPNFMRLRDQYRSITKSVHDLGGRVKTTCGMHYHLLTPGFAEPVPVIILANLWNLVRRYSPELKFLCSTGNKREALCRRRNHNSHLEMVKLSPVTMSMPEIFQTLKQSKQVPMHQNFLNLEHIRFIDDDQKIKPFHLEFRFPDTTLSANAITAFNFLFLSLLLKAVDLSQYGIIHVGNVKEWRRKIEILNLLNNNEGNLACSDTSQVNDAVIYELRSGLKEMLLILESTFERLGVIKVKYLLEALSDQPISLLRCSGMNWLEIEDYLNRQFQVEVISFDKQDLRVMQAIELYEWMGFGSKHEWSMRVALELCISKVDLETSLMRIHERRGLKWDTQKGAFSLVN